MRRLSILPLFALLLATGARASTLVLPFQTIGLDDATATVAAGVLREDLQARGVLIVPTSVTVALPMGTEDPAAASEAARAAGADRVVYGSLSRLGEKIICRVHALKVGETTPFFNDQLNSMTVEDLDVIMRRFAEAIAAEQPTVGGPSIDTVTREETRKPRTQASRRGIGMRAGFLWPMGDSYGGAERLTSIRFAYKYETHDYLIETTTLTGLAWGGSEARSEGKAIDWTILDLYGAKIYGIKDRATYAGGGLGVHSVRVERNDQCYRDPYYGYEWCETREDSQTTLTADAGVGMLFLRTHDFQVALDLRYHVTFSGFGGAGGNGAHGIALSFGTTR
jgi:TolB-like protein